VIEAEAEQLQKPTVNDIARVAKVSLATVDRVLNGRSGVRQTTIERVNSAIAQLGYVRDTAAANLARKRLYRLLFILPETSNEFVLALKKELTQQYAQMLQQRTQIKLVSVSPFDPQAIVDTLDGQDADGIDGIAVFGPETPSVRDAVNRASEKGIAIVALISDLPSSVRNQFVGIDNVAAGRTAGSLMGRFVQDDGQILVITGSRLARDHLERRSGFDTIINEHFSNLNVVASIEGRDDPELIRKMLPKIFESHPDIRGIYSSAAGNLGLIKFLEESDVAQDLKVIAHELTPLSRDALERGIFDALISQDTGHLIRSAIRLLKATADKSPYDLTQEQIRIDIYLRENLPLIDF
jgi:LacI family transcriptional regulator